MLYSSDYPDLSIQNTNHWILVVLAKRRDKRETLEF